VGVAGRGAAAREGATGAGADAVSVAGEGTVAIEGAVSGEGAVAMEGAVAREGAVEGGAVAAERVTEGGALADHSRSQPLIRATSSCWVTMIASARMWAAGTRATAEASTMPR